MNKHSLALLALAAALAIAPAARADSFDIAFSGPGGVTGSATLDAIFEGPGVWLLDSGSGTFDDGFGPSAINLIANPAGPGGSSLSPSGFLSYDDLLFPWDGPNELLTVNGLLFSYEGMELNLWQGGGGPGTDGGNEASGLGNGPGGSGTFTITSMDILPSETPEPGTLLLMGSGLCSLAGIVSRKAAKARLTKRI